MKFCFSLRKTREPRRYTLINNPTAMQQPLFGANDDDEDEIEDDIARVSAMLGETTRTRSLVNGIKLEF